MKVVIETKGFQEMVSKAIKCCGREPQLLMTMCLNIEIKDRVVILTSTDMKNTMQVKSNSIFKDGDTNFYTCVNCDTFAKLISKLNAESITLEVTGENNSVLSVKANTGKYPFPIYMDMDGVTPIKINMPEFNNNALEREIKGTEFRSILTYNKNCLLQNSTNNQVYASYYMDDKGVATFDEVKACVNSNVKVTSTPILLRKETAELVDVFVDSKVSVKVDQNKVKLSNGNIDVIGTLLGGAESFPIEPIRNLAEQNKGSFVKVSKVDLINCLDRLMLFLDEKEMYSAQTVFDNKSVIFTGFDNSDIMETVVCTEGSTTTPVLRCLSVKELKIQVSACGEDSVKLCFSGENGLTIESTGITQFVPYLVQDDEEIG